MGEGWGLVPRGKKQPQRTRVWNDITRAQQAWQRAQILGYKRIRTINNVWKWRTIWYNQPLWQANIHQRWALFIKVKGKVLFTTIICVYKKGKGDKIFHHQWLSSEKYICEVDSNHDDYHKELVNLRSQMESLSYPLAVRDHPRERPPSRQHSPSFQIRRGRLAL